MAKRWFFVPTLLIVFALAVDSMLQWRQSHNLGWALPFAALMTLPMFLGALMTLAPVARTSRSLVVLWAIPLVLVSLVPLVFGASSARPMGYATVGLIACLVYVFWYSTLGRQASGAIEPGKMLPDFTLRNLAGDVVRGHSYRGQPAVFLFIRGNWCPLCIAQVREISGLYKKLSARGVKVALISPQPSTETEALAKRFEVQFDYLVDENAEAARALGIFHAGGTPAGIGLLYRGVHEDTVYPTVVVTDANGVVLFADQTDNYRVRPEPETFLAVLDEATRRRHHASI